MAQSSAKIKSMVKGNFLILIGYLLSPLSWWNDLYVNIPVSWIIATIFSIFSKKLFLTVFISTYWLSNFSGFLLMYIGTKKVLFLEHHNNSFSKNALVKYFLISLTYTLIIFFLIRLKIIQPFISFKR